MPSSIPPLGGPSVFQGFSSQTGPPVNFNDYYVFSQRMGGNQ